MSLTILFRHLPTVDDSICKHTCNDENSPFLPAIESQLLKLKAEIKKIISTFNIRRVYVSNNTRGIGTANLLDVHRLEQVEFIVDSRLNNMIQPEWRGHTKNQMKSTPIYSIWHSTPESAHFKNGETLGDVEKRIGGFHKEMIQTPSMVISHTTPMQVLACVITNISVNNIWRFAFCHYRFSLFFNTKILALNSLNVSDIKVEDFTD